jgi:hypothetical protein
MVYEPNRDREQPVEETRDGFRGETPMHGSMLPVGGPGNDPDADKLGDNPAEVDERGPGAAEGRDANRAEENAEDAARVMPGPAPADAGAPFLAAGLAMDDQQAHEADEDLRDDELGNPRADG